MKIKLIVSIFLTALIFISCDDFTDLTPPVQNQVSGNANFARYVAIGNSLTAGYQSSSLYQSSQEYSYPNLIARQVGLTSFEQPLISDPGIGGLIKIVNPDPNNFVTMQEPVQAGTPLNLNYPAPYNNLGIPGIVLADVMNSTTSASSYSKSAFIDIILRGNGTQFSQATALAPTFITLWIGNNDVLGYATSGGANPTSPTPSATFTGLFTQLADGLAATGAKVVVANIPSVTAIPFFTTVGPPFGAQLKALNVPAFYFQSGSYIPTLGFPDQLIDKSLLLTLVSQTYLADFGKPSGRFYRDYGIQPSAVGVDTTQPFGASQGNPIPNALILDANEIQIASNSTNDFNTAISAAVNTYPNQFALVDINSIFNDIAANGVTYSGINYTTTFVSGGLFSLDGVHPTSQGYAIIANEFIKIINIKFGATIPLIDVSSIPGSLILAKRNLDQLVLPDYDYSMLKNLCF
jgi:lysophospholipase L1-like esterase